MLRTLAKDVESELGVSCVVENKTGGGGWVGWDYVSKADPDGYTLGYIVSTNLITGMMNPTTQREQTLDSFEYVIEHVEEPMCVAVRADDDRFNSMEELVEYSKTTQLTTCSLGVAGVVHIAGVRLNNELGMDMRFVQFEGASDALTATLGGHIDVYLAKVTEVSGPRDEGQLKVLAVLADERSERMSDVPTIKELYDKDITVASVRGVVAPEGTDPAIVTKLANALEAAMNKPEHIEATKAAGVALNPLKEDAFKEKMEKDEEVLQGMKSMFGW